VFSGGRKQKYVESDQPEPLGAYSSSKAEAELRVALEHPDALIVRTSAFFGPWDSYNFVFRALRAVASGAIFSAPANTYVSPSYLPHLAHATLDLLVDGEKGIWHLANDGEISWAELARLVTRAAGLDDARVDACPGDICGTVLKSERGILLPKLQTAIEDFFRTWEVDWRAPL
jgi:dTDP-4-dehydrorhamnose reductase